MIDDNDEGGNSGENRGNSFTDDPSYAAYFYSNSRFDPRLPPPTFYSPGQSWQMWPSSIGGGNVNNSGGSAVGGVIRGRNSFVSTVSNEETLSQQRKKLVDMIQEDFPRTPSPVHTLQQQAESATGLHLLGDSQDSKPIRTGGSKKPFSISGSVDAVMAAAIEAEQYDESNEISFGFEKLNLLPEEDEEGENVSWSKNPTLRMTATTREPFVMSNNYVPFIPPAAAPIVTLNSAPARSGNTGPILNSPPYGSYTPVYPDENLKLTIMEDFRMNRSKRYELIDLKGMMIDFSTDQHGSRFIQQKLETASEGDKELVFGEIYHMALQLMTDVFGNYVIQKFFEHGSTGQRVALARVMRGHVLSLSLQMYGCRVVQKALEHVPGDEQTILVQELEGHVLRCVKDQNGNHVIQKCIECVPLRTSAPFLTASFLSQASNLAMHPYGCRVIQRIFEHGPPEHAEALLDELLKNTGLLIQDQYGNYVIQHVLEHGHPSERTRIIKFLQGRLLEYSKHKFASNVVEKCVSFGTEPERQELIEEILQPIPSEDGEDVLVVPLHLMMKDQFANYVVQKMLEIVDGEQRDLLLNCIKPQLSQLRKYTYGKHILAKVEKMLGLAPSQPVEPVATAHGHSGYNGYNGNSGYHLGNNYNNSHSFTYQNNREYHSAPNSPMAKPSTNFDSPYHPPQQQRQAPRAGATNPKFSKNDMTEFPPLNSKRK